MKVETKSAAILAATLALGVVIGMMTQAMMARGRGYRLAELRRPPRFVAHLERVLEPAPDQATQVRAILESTATRNRAIIDAAHAALRTELDSMKVRLGPVLTDAQNQRLERQEPLPDPFRPPPPRDGPPPRGGIP